MQTLKISVVCGLLAIAAACTPREKSITIIAVNDIHGKIDNFPRLATLVGQYDSLRTVLVDGGDRWTGNPFVDRAVERGKPVIDLQNELGFDLSTLGNHEFDFGLEVVSARMKEARFPFTSANIDSNGSILPQPEPYVLMDVDGVKLCFIGTITTARAGYPDGFVENFGSIKFSHPIAATLSHRDMRDKSDVMIALTHTGAEVDSVLARQMPELDLIIGGHSHTLLPDDIHIGNVLVTQAGSRLHYANVITVKMRGRKLAGISGRLVDLDTLSPDPKIAAMVDSYYQMPELNEVKGRLTTSLSKTGILNMTTDIIRESTRSDLAVYNWGGIRVDTLPAGDLKAVDFYSMEPFGNKVSILKLTEQQIRALIFNKFSSLSKNSRREDIIPSGFTYWVRTDENDDPVELVLDLERKPGPDGTFRVATSDYLDATYDFPGAGTGEPTGIIVSHMLMQYFEKHHTFTGDNTPRTGSGQYVPPTPLEGYLD